MKTNKKESRQQINLRITEALESIYEKYQPDRALTLDNFYPSDEAEKIMTQLVGEPMESCPVGDSLSWTMSGQYTAPISLIVASDYPLHYNKDGFLRHPLRLFDELVSSSLSERIMNDFCGNSFSFAYGSLDSNDTSCCQDLCNSYKLCPIFQAYQQEDAQVFHLASHYEPERYRHLLMMVKWGGAESNTRGITEEIAKDVFAAMSFLKVSSNGGKEGIDYIVLPIDKVPLGRLLSRYYESLQRQEQQFAMKWKHYIQILADYEATQEYYQNLQIEACELGEKYRRCEVAALSFVEIPHCNMDKLKFEAVKPSLDDSYEQLAEKAERIADRKTPREYLDSVIIVGENWQKFAPLFAKLQPMVQNLKGWIHIAGNEATVSLPSHCSIAGMHRKYDTTKYALSAVRLKDCAKDLQKYKADEDMALVEFHKLMKTLWSPSDNTAPKVLESSVIK